MNPLYYEIYKELDEKLNYQHAQWLTDNTPSRISGMGDDRRAAEYLVEQYQSYGLDAKVLDIEIYNSNPIESKLSITYPEKRELNSIVCCHIKSTPDDGLNLETVYVGPGDYDDYKGIDVRGKAVVAEVSFKPGSP